MFQKLKLRNRMLVLILGINLVMMVVVYLAYFGYSKKEVVQQTQEKTIERVRAVSSAIEGYFIEKAKIAWTYAQNPHLVHWLATNTSRDPLTLQSDPVYRDIITHFKNLVAQDSEIKAAFLASERTQYYYEDAERIMPEDYLVGKRPWYIKAKSIGKPFFNCDIDLLDQEVYLNYMYPIYDEGGEWLGVAGIDISLDNLRQFMVGLDLFATGEAFLVGEDGLILYHPDENLVFKKKITDFQDKGRGYRNMNTVSRMILNHQSGIEKVVFNGEKRYFNFTPIGELGWTLVLSVATHEINAPLNRLSRTSILIILGTSLFLIGAVVLITGSITRPIHKVVSMIRDIAEGEGDLTRRLEVDSKDELGELAHWFNIFVDNLHNIVAQVKKNAEEVSTATREISTTSAQLASGAEDQTSQTSEVAVSVQQMAAVIVQNSQNATNTARIAEEASRIARDGTEAMQETQDGMEEIVASSRKTGEIIDSLSGRAEQIGAIIRVIDDIAAQTNLLALNAAIEAASAGEHGRGFTVVADEVRALAERTKEATREIGKTIKTIQEDTREVAQSMEVGQNAVHTGKEAMVKTEKVLQGVVSSVSEAMGMIQQIAVASREQSSGAEEISKNVAAISTVTKQSASGAEQMATTAERLSRQTDVLRHLVDRFKVLGTEEMPQ
jgi:methyl-accepting chemotaxis protein